MTYTHFLHGTDPEDTWPESGVPCCYWLAFGGRCTCWDEVFDLEQLEAIPGEFIVRPDGACHDCACRNDAPEREDGDHPVLDLAMRGERFYCHEGMRRALAEVHPDGRRREMVAGAYRPAQVDGVPYRADGTPAFICGGWAALHGTAG